LKLAVGAVLVVLALGAGGVAYQVGGPRAAGAAPEGKPASELEALRKENELLKYNLQLVLEKAHALEADVRALKGQAKAGKVYSDVDFYVVPQVPAGDVRNLLTPERINFTVPLVIDSSSSLAIDPVQEVEAALQKLREAKGTEARRRAGEALEQAVKKLREKQKGPEKPGKPQGK
jgi:hypothetical protein